MTSLRNQRSILVRRYASIDPSRVAGSGIGLDPQDLGRQAALQGVVPMNEIGLITLAAAHVILAIHHVIEVLAYLSGTK